MTRRLLTLAAITLAALAILSAERFAPSPARADTPPAVKKVRIGVYDPRAIALAYGRSPMFSRKLAEKKKEMDDAQLAKDQHKIDELKAWGPDQQIKLHFQVFAGTAVDDILAQVQDQLPQVAAANDVQSIGPRPDYTGTYVEIVDVTADLVNLWHPDAKTLEMISGIEKTPPVSLADVAKMGANQ
ncbi:MAG: hypothetical protein ABSH22_20825 [Tepidisphaeraceae bacterium]|jgi:hypothetical protein